MQQPEPVSLGKGITMAPTIEAVVDQLHRTAETNQLRARDILRRLEERGQARDVVEKDYNEPSQASCAATLEPAAY